MSVHKTALLGATACAVLANASLQAAEPPKALGPGEEPPGHRRLARLHRAR